MRMQVTVVRTNEAQYRAIYAADHLIERQFRDVFRYRCVIVATVVGARSAIPARARIHRNEEHETAGKVTVPAARAMVIEPSSSD